MTGPIHYLLFSFRRYCLDTLRVELTKQKTMEDESSCDICHASMLENSGSDFLITPARCSSSLDDAIPFYPSSNSSDSGYRTSGEFSPASDSTASAFTFNVDELDFFRFEEMELENDVFEEQNDVTAKRAPEEWIERPLPQCTPHLVPLPSDTLKVSLPVSMTGVACLQREGYCRPVESRLFLGNTSRHILPLLSSTKNGKFQNMEICAPEDIGKNCSPQITYAKGSSNIVVKSMCRNLAPKSSVHIAQNRFHVLLTIRKLLAEPLFSAAVRQYSR